MRIIDADTLKAYFFRPYSNEESYSNIDIEKIINEQITINPERKTGKWEIKYSKHGVIFPICSNCDYTATNWLKTKYCPNCGSKMEVDDADRD